MALYLPKLIPDSVPGLPTNIQLPAAIQEPQVVLNAPKIIPYTLPYNPNWRYVPWQRSPNFMFDYNDPNQINSIPDIISASLKSASPFKTLLSETFQFVKRGTIDPLRAGEFGQAGINALINFTETADILANPTKALLMGHGFEGAANALGFGGDGRVNYDWDTGSLFKDIVLEIVSDPTVWLSLGIKAVGTLSARSALRPAIKAAAGEAADEFDDKVYKNLAKGMVEAFYQKDTQKFIQKAEAVAQRLSVMKPGVDVPPQEFAKALVKATQVAKESIGHKIGKTLYTAGQLSDKVDRVIFKAALTPSIYPTWWLAKRGFGAVEKQIHNRVVATYKRYLRPDGALSITDFDELVFVAKENEAVFSTLQKLLKLGDVDVPKYVLLQLDTGIRKDVETILELFGKYNDNYEKLTSELTRYMQKTNKVNSLEIYVGVLQKVNSRVDGYFDYAIKNYEVIINHLADLKKFIESSNIAAAYKNLPEITRKNYNEIIELFQPAAKAQALEDLALMYRHRDKLSARPDFAARYIIQAQKALTTTEWNINVAVRTQDPGIRGSKILDAAVAYYPAELRSRLFDMISELPLEARNMMEVPIVETVERYTREVYKTFDNFLKSYRTDPQAVFRYPLVSKYILDVIDKMDRLYSAFADEIAFAKAAMDTSDPSNLFDKLLKEMSDPEAYDTFQAVMDSTLTSLGRASKKVEQAGVEQEEFIKGFKQLDDMLQQFDIDDLLNVEARNFHEGSRAYIVQLFEEVSRLRSTLDEEDGLSLFLQEAPEKFDEVSRFLKAKQAQLKKQYGVVTRSEKVVPVDVSEKVVPVDGSKVKKPNTLFQYTKQTPTQVPEFSLEVIEESVGNTKLFVKRFDKLKKLLQDFDMGDDFNLRKKVDEAKDLTEKIEVFNEAMEFLKQRRGKSLDYYVTFFEKNKTFPPRILEAMTKFLDETDRARMRLSSKNPKYITEVITEDFSKPIKNFDYSDLEEPTYQGKDFSFGNETTLPKLFADITKFLEETDHINPLALEDVMMTLAENPTVAQLRMEAVSASLDLTTRGEVGAFFKKLRDKTDPLTQMINFWAERARLPQVEDVVENALVQASSDLLDAAYKASAYSQLLNNISAIFSGVTGQQKVAFISTFQNYAQHKPDDFLKSDYWINKIFSDTNVTMRTSYARQKYGLDMMMESIDDWGKKLSPKFKDYLSKHRHTAPGDVALQYAWMKEVRPDIFEKYPNLILFDIETTGNKEVYGEVLEIAFIDVDGKPHHFIRKIPESRLDKSAGEMYLDISQEVLEVLFRDIRPEDRMAAFRKKFVAAPGEKTMSQQELLASFSNALPEKNATIMAHNGLEFDYKYLDWKRREYGADLKMDNYRNAAKTDSLQELLKLDGDLVLSARAQEKFRDYFVMYAMQMKELGSRTILDNGAKSLKQGLSEFRSLLIDNKFDLPKNYKLIQEYAPILRGVTTNTPKGNSLARLVDYKRPLFSTVRKPKTQRGYYKGTPKLWKDSPQATLGIIMQNDVFSELDHLHEVVAEILDSVNNHGKVYSTQYLTDPFRKITPETRQAVTPELRAKYGPNAEAVLLAARITHLTPDEIFRVFGSNLNLYRLLRGGKALPDVFYKNAVDNRFAQHLFDVPDTSKMSRYILKRLTQFSKSISESYSKIKTPYIILKHAVEIQKIFDQIREIWIHPFRADLTDPIEQFFIIKHLFMEVPDQGTGTIRNVYKTELLQDPLNMSKELRELIDDPERIYHYTLYGQALSKDEALATFSMTSLSFDADYLDALIEENIRQVHNLEMIGAGIDNKLIQANVYAGASIQKPILDIQKRLQKMTPTERVITIQKYKDAADVMGDQQVKFFLRKAISDPDYLISTLVWEAPWVTFSAKQLGNTTEVQDLLKTLMKDEALWNEKGVYFKIQDNRVCISLDRVKNRVDSDIIKDAMKHSREVRSLNGISIPRPEHTPLELPDFLDGIDKIDFQKVMDSLNNLSAGSFSGSSGNLITKSRLQKYYAMLPDDVAQRLGPVDRLIEDKFWKGIKFDWINIGTPASRKYLEERAYKTILDSYKNAMRMGATITESRNLYLSLYFNSQMDINAGALKEISDQALLDSLKRNDEFVLTALVEDASPASHGYRVVKLRTETLEDIAQARRLGAIIVPYQTFATAFQTLNADVFSNQFLNFWHKVIYAYKVGFLLDPGVVVRNALDSTLKNVVSADGNVALVAKKQAAAMQLLHRYNRSLTAILNSNKNKFNYENVKLYFEKLNKDPSFTQEQFEYIHGFIIYSASAGLTGPWKKYLKSMNVSLKEQEDIWTTFVIAADWLMTPNKYIEQVNRLAMYMMLEENGLTKTQIFKRIAETHFDYNIKTDTEKLMELIFPFYTFTMRNLEYWINTAMERPWMGSLFEDIMEPIWNFDGLPQEELAYNRSLQHQVMMGNIPINEAVPAFGGITLKINPSYMDVYNLLLDVPHTMVALTNPTMMESGDIFSEIQSKMAPPFQLLRAQGALASGLFDTGASTYAEGDSAWQTVMRNLPLVGAAMTRYQSGPKYAERTGHEWQKAPLTQGTFGATQRWQPKVVKPKKRKTVGGSDSSVTVAKKYVSSYRPNHRAYYPKRAYSYWKDYNSFYRKHYTKKGVSKFKLRSMPYNSRNIHYRIKDLYWYFR